MTINDFVIHVATVNGSGSQTANNALVKSLFRSGLPVSGKNLFPSNIQGLPTWFTIRVSGEGKLSRRSPHDIVIAMNPNSVAKDIHDVTSGGYFFYNSEMRFDLAILRKDVTNIGIPFAQLVLKASDSIQIRKLLTNMVYVGVMCQLLKIRLDVAKQVVTDQFGKKQSAIDVNHAALDIGFNYAKENLKDLNFKFSIQEIPDGNKGKILIDGNTAAGMGLVFGGCTVASWYPITPSTSLLEAFEKYAKKYRKDKDGKNTFAVVQAEDELSAITMVLGAGWAGARAMTATSGPGLSLMAEAAGMAYFSEIPSVIWDVQRVGPSTGLPTRTMQGDLLSAALLSHGDTKQVVLLPGTPGECFEFGQTAFDLAERLQTLVVVLSDLDLGMNLSITDEFKIPSKPFDRGKVLDKDALEKAGSFARYKDIDGDGIPYRTLPGTEHKNAAYFTRGTGHDENSAYTEDNKVFRKLMERLNRKFETAKNYVPKPIVQTSAGAKVGILGFGSSDNAIQETRMELAAQGKATNYCRVRAFPFSNEVEDFIKSNEKVFVVEQNRDGQMLQLLRMSFPQFTNKFVSLTQFDGLPLEGKYVQEGMGL